jgi:hypothetical protein
LLLKEPSLLFFTELFQAQATAVHPLDLHLVQVASHFLSRKTLLLLVPYPNKSLPKKHPGTSPVQTLLIGQLRLLLNLHLVIHPSHQLHPLNIHQNLQTPTTLILL